MLSDAEASNIKQLATGFQFIEELRSDPRGKFFVFSSMKDGKSHLFRIDVDSGTVKQLTFDDREIDSTISPDGKYLTYDSCSLQNGVETYALKRIPVDGGEPVTLRPKGCFIPTYSPDGSMLSCVDTEKRGIMIVSATDGSELERHPLPINATWNFGVGWTPDGSGLIYIGTEKNVSNLWVQPRDGTKPRSLTSFSSGIIYRYAFAADGSKLYLARGYPTQDAILISNYR
jgi:Tol biopolymer transport system component